MKTLYIHIGTEKTGTTSIQESLFVNKEMLFDNGIYFIQSMGKRNNRALPSLCMKEEKIDDFYFSQGINDLESKNELNVHLKNKFIEELNGIPDSIDKVVCSSEHFHSRTNSRKEIQYLYELVSSYFEKIKIICYVRSQIETCQSLYSTMIRSGGAPDFDNYLSTCNVDNIYFNYYDMLENWSDVFGFENIIVRYFSKNHFYDNDLISDFYNMISPNLINSLDRKIELSNQSVNFFGQSLAKTINLTFKGDDYSTIRSQCLDIIFMSFRGKGREIPEIDADRISKEFYESNVMLSNKYFNGLVSIENSFKAIDDNIDLYELESALIKILKIIKIKTISDKDIDKLRDLALAFENVDVALSYELMSLAAKLRPNGVLINNKVKEYLVDVNGHGDC